MYDFENIFRQAVTTDAACPACNCIGPQNGQPACPCAMRNVKVVDGRYVRVQDLGPANPHVTTVRFGGLS